MLSLSRLLNDALSESDALRYGGQDPRRSGSIPAHLLHFVREKRPVVVWNVTRACNLRCAHCYASAQPGADPRELSTAEAEAVIDDLAAFGVPVVLFSGGEPLCRPDLLHLARRAAGRGLRCVLSTNGTLIDAGVAADLKRAGFSYVGISIDGAEPVHDRFRGAHGAFAATLRGIRACRAVGVKVGLRFTLTSRNADQLAAVFDLLEAEDVARLCVYHLAYAGRGARIAGWDLTHRQTRAAMDLIIERTRAMAKRQPAGAGGGGPDSTASGSGREVLTVDNHADAPYLYLRVLAERPQRAAEVYRLLRRNGGNGAGVSIGCIDWAGEVHPDQFWWQHSLGNVRQRAFSAIWQDDAHPLLAALRNRRSLLHPRCQGCRFLGLCNGNLRARGEAATGDPWGFDPACYLRDDEIRTAGDLPPWERAALEAAPERSRVFPSLSSAAAAARRERDARMPATDFNQAPFTVVWEVTQACALVCRHCRAAARPCRHPDELTTAEGHRLIDDIARFGQPIFILTGGDPFMRRDLYDLLAYAAHKGLRTGLAPSATALVTPRALRRVAEAGVRRIAFSLDGSSAAVHDAFRGVRGCFDRTLAIFRMVREAGLSLQVNTTVTRYNFDDLEAIAGLVGEFGAVQWSVFFLVPTGRGQVADMISPEQHEQVYRWLARLSRAVPFDIKSTAAPAYRRVLIQERLGEGSGRGGEPPAGAGLAGAGFRDGMDRPALGVNDGDGFLFVSHLGDVCPSGFLPLVAGNVRRQSVVDIYRHAPLFVSLRDRSQLKGKCRACGFRQVCGGSRARAYALTGDYLAAEPTCVYQPA